MNPMIFVGLHPNTQKKYNREVLKKYVDEILLWTSKYFNVSVDQIYGKNRSDRISRARHIAQYFLKKIGLSYSHICEIFKKDHNTVWSAINKIENQRITDKTIYNACKAMDGKISRMINK